MYRMDTNNYVPILFIPLLPERYAFFLPFVYEILHLRWRLWIFEESDLLPQCEFKSKVMSTFKSMGNTYIAIPISQLSERFYFIFYVFFDNLRQVYYLMEKGKPNRW